MVWASASLVAAYSCLPPGEDDSLMGILPADSGAGGSRPVQFSVRFSGSSTVTFPVSVSLPHPHLSYGLVAAG